MTSWTVVDDVLMLRTESGAEETPSAREIFEQAFSKEIRSRLPPLPHDITWHRTPLDLKLTIAVEHGSVRLRVIAVGDGVVRELSGVRSRSADHLLLGKDWYPFSPGDLESVSDVLSLSGLDEGCSISLSQYIGILRSATAAVHLETADAELSEAERVLLDNYVPPPCLSVLPLYPYQLEGYRWLSLLSENGVGGVLADEMGLGKTVQLLALIAAEAARSRRPSLVVAPLTIQENWSRETARFTPQVKFARHYGRARAALAEELREFDLIITSYETLARDLSLFRQIAWDVVVLDEAQAIRNPDTRRSRTAKRLRRRIGVASTGTPIQNRLLDLWSLMDFAAPGLLGDAKDFLAGYGNSIDDARRLRHLTAALIMRRRIAEVAGDLPEKIIIPQPLQLDAESAQEYEELRRTIAHDSARVSVATLTLLRMYCAHPFLVDIGQGDPTAYSRKYQRLVQLLEEILSNSEKCIIFTGYRRMIDLLTTDLPRRLGVPTEWIDGRTPPNARQEIVDRFSGYPEGAVICLNPAAAGVGLNITAANHVIHYSLEWNPAVEDQASARAYRRGQTRPVTIHRMFYLGTVEEVVESRLAGKRDLASEAVAETDPGDRADILRALAMAPTVGE